jgi:hypothetical protein
MMNELLLNADQGQFAAVVTRMVPLAPMFPRLTDGGFTV